MPFSSSALGSRFASSRRIAVGKVFEGSFRIIGWLRFAKHLVLFTLFFIYYATWLIIRLFSKLLHCFGCGDGAFASSASIRELVLRCAMGAANLGKHGRWKAFWRVYAVLAPTLDDFINDYCEAWKLRHTIDKEVIIFIDNDHRLAIPCSGTMDDKALVRHIRVFYNLARARVGIFEFFGAKSTLRIDVVKLEQHFAVGARVGPPLGLGRHGPFSRLVHYLKDPSKMSGTDLVQRLETEAVLTPPGQQTCALNIVRSWDPYITSTIILIPVVLSFIVSVLWSVIAAAYFKADVNASTQTAFTIGSYVVTAGALLIALVAFLESKYVANDGVSNLVTATDYHALQQTQSNSSCQSPQLMQRPPAIMTRTSSQPKLNSRTSSGNMITQTSFSDGMTK